MLRSVLQRRQSHHLRLEFGLLQMMIRQPPSMTTTREHCRRRSWRSREDVYFLRTYASRASMAASSGMIGFDRDMLYSPVVRSCRRRTDVLTQSYLDTRRTIASTRQPFGQVRHASSAFKRSRKRAGGPRDRNIRKDTVNNNNNKNDVLLGFQSGPSLQLGVGKLARHAASSVVATAGQTIVTVTVAHEFTPEEEVNNNTPKDDSAFTHSTPFLTVDYRQRAAGVGHIPTNVARNDFGRPGTEETLGARALDRALRPLLVATTAPNSYGSGGSSHPSSIARTHVQAVVQATDAWPDIQQDAQLQQGCGHVVATAINASAAALGSQLSEPVAATVLTVLSDGTVVQDAGPEYKVQPSSFEDSDETVYCVGDLLYAGTRDKCVMLEFTGVHSSLPEDQWAQLLNLASAAIQPLLDTVSDARILLDEHKLTRTGTAEEDFERRNEIKSALGLDSFDATHTSDVSAVQSNESIDSLCNIQKTVEAVEDYCRERLGDSVQRLFGKNDETEGISRDRNADSAHVDNGSSEILSKTFRGQREQVLQQEISRLTDEYIHKFIKDDTPLNSDAFPTVIGGMGGKWLKDTVVERLFRTALWETTELHGTRSDGRRGAKGGQAWKTVRPLSITVPALPDTVHGSSVFARGDTQVLCTVTLGAPSDGPLRSDPYKPTSNPRLAPEQQSSDLPVGSLRFLKSQPALESDLNSRRSLADKERTGSSGSLSRVQRAVLHYDFPAYSTGSVPKTVGIDRRSIGHGALAQRAILPVLPDAHDFPYAMRITSEVTDSNGSSSMASVVGATLALQDAGVPLKAPVAGVSVGLAVGKDDDARDVFSLLLDITGTEDHYGAMDFKIAGTERGVTAVQLDVKQPLPLEVLVDALLLAKKGRKEILNFMRSATTEVFQGSPQRPEPKESTPRVEVVRFDPERKRDLVGPGGVVLRQLEDRYGVSIDLTQEGQCLLFGANRNLVASAKKATMELVSDVTVGETYTGTVIEIKDFGAIIELLRNKEGLLHVSELTLDQYNGEGTEAFVSNRVKVGEELEVLCIGIDPVQGSIKLSRREVLKRKMEHAAESI